jgi:hypothetical protein
VGFAALAFGAGLVLFPVWALKERLAGVDTPAPAMA